jgi:hypothetical protein
MTLKKVALLSLAIALCACAKVPFTKKLVADNNLKPEDLKQLQFYVSSKVVLRHEVSKDQPPSVTGHELKIVQGKEIEEVVIEANTPGVALTVEADKDVLKIAFEDGDRTFTFRTVENVPAMSLAETKKVKAGGQEIVVKWSESTSWDRRFKLASDSWSDNKGSWSGPMSYDSKPYVCDSGAGAYLMIKKSSLNKIVTKRKVLPGRVLPMEPAKETQKDTPQEPPPKP